MHIYLIWFFFCQLCLNQTVYVIAQSHVIDNPVNILGIKIEMNNELVLPYLGLL